MKKNETKLLASRAVNKRLEMSCMTMETAHGLQDWEVSDKNTWDTIN